MLIDVPDRYARRLGRHLRRDIEQIGRSGAEPDPGLIRLAAQLDRYADRYTSPRALSLGAERIRRWRLRQQGEDIPLRRPGPQPRSHAG